jgi:hypothetical protein
MLNDAQNLIYVLRSDPNVSKVDILDDLELHMVKILHCIVTTPSVTNYVLPIDDYDHNDVFLTKDKPVCSEV